MYKKTLFLPLSCLLADSSHYTDGSYSVLQNKQVSQDLPISHCQSPYRLSNIQKCVWYRWRDVGSRRAAEVDSGGRGEELPWVSHGQFQTDPSYAKAEPTSKVCGTSVKMYGRDNRKHQGRVGGWETTPKNQTKQTPKKPNPRENSEVQQKKHFRERGEGRVGSPGAREEIPCSMWRTCASSDSSSSPCTAPRRSRSEFVKELQPTWSPRQSRLY